MKKLVTMAILAGMMGLVGGCDEDERIVYVYPDTVSDDAYGDEGEEEGEPLDACVPQCSGKECGDDGCGGTCGGCGYDETCNVGVCMSECGACTQTQCSWQMENCEANWECGALLSCAAGCGSDSCIESCIYSYIDGADDLMNLLECMDSKCSYAC